MQAAARADLRLAHAFGMIERGRLKILALYPDEDLTEWRNYRDHIPASWINAYDVSCLVRQNGTYDLIGHSVALPAGTANKARAGEGFHRRALYRRGYRPERVGRPALSAVLPHHFPSLSFPSRHILSSCFLFPLLFLFLLSFLCRCSRRPRFCACGNIASAISVAYRPIKKDNRDLSGFCA